MVAYSFKDRFVPLIVARTKQQTIRQRRKGRSRHARHGEILQLFHGDRFHPKRIGEATCEEVGFVLLSFATNRVSFTAPRGLMLMTRAAPLDRFARRDGFEDWSDMARFWLEVHETRTFGGALIFWGSTFRVSQPPAGADDATIENIDDGS